MDGRKIKKRKKLRERERIRKRKLIIFDIILSFPFAFSSTPLLDLCFRELAFTNHNYL